MAVFGLCFGNACATVAAYSVSTLDSLPKILTCAHPLKFDVILQGGKREVLANEFGERTTPTLVTYLENEKVGTPTNSTTTSQQDEIGLFYSKLA